MVPENSLITPADEARFWAKIDRRGPDECWEWTAARHDRGGYGLMHVGGRIVRANRVALEFALGRPLSPEMKARHSCDNPPCCNPSHLVEGTQKQNMHDARDRDRHRRGERGAIKLSDASVLALRDDVASGMTTARAAAKYGVSPAMASLVANGKRWAHLSGPITHGRNKSHCINGHEYTEENTLLRNGGSKKVCRACNNASQARYRNKKEQ